MFQAASEVCFLISPQFYSQQIFFLTEAGWKVLHAAKENELKTEGDDERGVEMFEGGKRFKLKKLGQVTGELMDDGLIVDKKKAMQEGDVMATVMQYKMVRLKYNPAVQFVSIDTAVR